MSGELGLRPTDMARSEYLSLDTGVGNLLAHDIVEHINGISAIGTVTDELEALAVVMIVRNNYAAVVTEEDLAYDVIECFRYYNPKTKAPVTHKHKIFEDAIEQILDLATEKVSSEIDDYCAETWERFRYLARAHMRIGTRKFFKKYPSNCAEAEAYETFCSIQKAVQNTEIYDGARYQLNVVDTVCTIHSLYEDY
ncbi:hypothetical protein AD45P2_00490 [Alteromonas phage vB_AmaP_AD45-P2]|uniref:Uncharacterized protein n=2 Tax=Pseudorhizobium pelagicum TaxID=1509405 RepID=A0A922P0H8_9HYPH|nr:hypothetical protein M610_gp084 [Alteromonas phage vB_AmaP_AD45-P1]AGM47031.1 hypothetical protein AD45P3_00465 [Alteromonas phage vB_AmaP_AD45-P3]AGM47147.1 hypothetical protein AD45P4_00460 [Alteromonas phage vB_AmaP_AD45-P4]AGM47269.1 hypothetical protein AD45P2_00490 [Alteromonas phage vB_AmaP_AD45-P2]KEQ05611.1 hypothetical protein GV68_08770 [Pseudorhizobium pelagicum]AGM46915.1 hypothetical protein AD45P1_00485 [Alteromonas phage vB_AmaP_AD45-P1]